MRALSPRSPHLPILLRRAENLISLTSQTRIPSLRPQMPLNPSTSFQDLILTLHQYGLPGCVILQPYAMEVGAGTFHPATTLRSVGPKPCRRLRAALAPPQGWPYGENPNRLQH